MSDGRPAANLPYLRRRPRRDDAQRAAASAIPHTADGRIDTSHPARTRGPGDGVPLKPSSRAPGDGVPLKPSSPKPSSGTPLTPPKPEPTPLTPPKVEPTPLTPPKVEPTPLAPPRAEPPQPPTPTPTPAAPSISLSVGRGAPPPPPGLPEPKRVDGRILLTAEARTVTLDRRQSAIGSLVFEIAGPGAVGAVWELQDGLTGLVDASVGTVVSPEYGRRPIVELTRQQIVIGLRHVHELRRVLILVSGFRGNDPQRLVAALHDGHTIESAHTSTTGPFVVALAMYQVDGELVIRREDAGFDSGESAAAAYGFSITWLPPVRRG